MLRAVAASIAFVLALAGAAGAAGPELKTDEQKTLYGLGLGIARNLTGFYLTKADLEVVEAGLAEGILKVTPKAGLGPWGPTIPDLATGGASTAARAGQKPSSPVPGQNAAARSATR